MHNLQMGRPFCRVTAVSSGQGFTIIEMIIVMSLIFLLAGIFLPSLARSKSAAKAVYCRNNLKQISIANAMYASDWQKYPEYFAGILLWHDLLEPYLTSAVVGSHTAPDGRSLRDEHGSPHWKRGVHRCPDLQLPGRYEITSVGGSIFDFNLGNFPEGDYSINDRATDNFNGIAGARESEIIAPARLLAFGDVVLTARQIMWRFSYTAFGDFRDESDDFKDLGSARREQARRHRGKWNIAFADTHVECTKSNAISAASTIVLRLWNRNDQTNRSTVIR